MFMFRSKRTTLAKRLWKARVLREHETSCETQTRNNETSQLLKRLTENQLEMLVAAIESRGADLSACVLLPREREPQVRCCQVWRWPDLHVSGELKRLPVCRSAKDPVYICCNPYHWSRLCKPESPPPPYCRFAKEKLKPEDRAPSEAMVHERLAPSSLTTNGEPVGNEWCKLAYWEGTTRVGRLFAVELSHMHVFDALPQGDGLCLAALARHPSQHPSQHAGQQRTGPEAGRARAKIGLGLTLSREPDGVWAYNRSDNPIFVNSPTLDDPESRTVLVYRVPSGHCLNIFNDSRLPATQQRCWDISKTGPVDPNSVRISFAKGWGPKYSRQEVTSCPCWLEVLLAPCR